LNRSQADTNRVKLLLDLSFIYVNRVGSRANDINASLSLTQQALLLSRSLQYKRGEGRGYLIMAKTLREKGDAQQGKVYAVRAMNLVKNLGYPELMGYVYSELARYYSDTQAGVSSQINLNELALSCFVRIGDRKKQADVLKELGDMYQLQGKYHQSISRLQRALKLYQSVNFPSCTRCLRSAGVHC
jgi:tetratricopeptide (TPR) repeat protein